MIVGNPGGMPLSNAYIIAWGIGHRLSEPIPAWIQRSYSTVQPWDHLCPRGSSIIHGVIKLIPTQHAVQRAKVRTGWCRHALERMFDRVFYFGLGEADCSGRLRDYMDKVSFNEVAPVVRLYGDHLFVFGHGCQADEMALITILHLPIELRALAHRTRAKSLGLAA